jgi:hypothetical protein
MKKLTAIIITAIMLTTTVDACAAWTFEDVREMIWGVKSGESPSGRYIPGDDVRGADIIIIGVVTDIEELSRQIVNDYFTRIDGETIYSIKITEVIKGDIQINETITVRTEGHKKPQNGVSMTSVDGPFLDLEQDYLLFLWKSNQAENRYSFNGASEGEGVFELEKNGYLFLHEWQITRYGFSSLAELREIIAAGRPEPVTGNDDNPPTSVTLAIIPTLLAGSVAVISRKRAR